jgi:hypothetical protein
VTASVTAALGLFLLAIVLRIINLKIMTGEMSMKRLSKAQFLTSVVTETLSTGFAGLAVSAEYVGN